MNTFKRNFTGRRKVFFIPFAIAAFILIFSTIVMLLWNALMPDIFGLQAISLWQAAGLLLLSKIFFGGFRGGPNKHRRGFWNENWKKHIPENWETMTAEEKNAFKEELKRRYRNCNQQDNVTPATGETL